MGGSTLSQVLLSAPPSWLINPAVLPTFAVIYHLSAPILPVLDLPWAPTVVLDLAFAGLDAVNRTSTAIAVVSLLAGHPDLQTSWLSAVLLGGIACSGGGLLCSTFGLWEPDGWRLQTPAILEPSASVGASALQTLDVWSGALVSVVYGTALDLPAFQPLRAFLLANFGRPASSPWTAALTQALGSKRPTTTTVEDAQTACTVLLLFLLIGRVVILRWPTTTTATRFKRALLSTEKLRTGGDRPLIHSGAPASTSGKVIALPSASQAPATPSGKTARRRKGKRAGGY